MEQLRLNFYKNYKSEIKKNSFLDLICEHDLPTFELDEIENSPKYNRILIYKFRIHAVSKKNVRKNKKYRLESYFKLKCLTKIVISKRLFHKDNSINLINF
jgi:hypothetical protein